MSSQEVADQDHRAVRPCGAARRIRPSGHWRGRAGDGGTAAHYVQPVRFGFQCRSVRPHAGCIWAWTDRGSLRAQVGADRRYGRVWCVHPLHRKRSNATATLAVPLPRRGRFGRGNAKFHQSCRGIHTAVKPAGGDWAAMDRISAWRIARVAADRCGGLAVIFYIGGILPLGLSAAP